MNLEQEYGMQKCGVAFRLKAQTFLVAMLALVIFQPSSVCGEEAGYTASVQLPSLSQDELAEVVMPQEVYKVTGGAFAWRVVKGEAKVAVPFLAEAATTKRCDLQRSTRPLQIRSVKECEEQRLQVVLSRTEASDVVLTALQGLAIYTPLRDFERLIKVEASDDASQWETVVEAARIFDVSAFANFRENEIALPGVARRFLRLTIDQKFAEATSRTSTVKTSEALDGRLQNIERQFVEERRPFRIERVEGWSVREEWVTDARLLTPRTFKLLPEFKDADMQESYPKASFIYFTCDKAPLERITVKSASKMFHVSSALFGAYADAETGKRRWMDLGRATFSRLSFRDYLREELRMSFRESVADLYCLVVFDGPETGAVALEACEGPEYRLIFPCSPGESLFVQFAEDQKGLPGYNSGQVRTLLNRGVKPLRATLGRLVQDPKQQGRGLKIHPTWLLSGAVVVVAAVLLAAVVMALKRMPGEEENPKE